MTDTASTLRVALDRHGYDIHIGAGLIARAGALIAPAIRQKRAVIVTDANVAVHYLAALTASLDAAGIAHHDIVLPPGERTKDFAHFARLCEDILSLGIERGTPLIALGGGVVGDLTGFAAATLLRGLDYVQVPTTLLAQVDSAVGGKTAIDSAHGKNLIGAFHQPVLVLADTGVLATLPKRELLAGYAEVVKYGVIRDAGFFAWLETNGAKLLAGDGAARAHAVRRSLEIKAAVVAADERETGERAILNYGHSFGHALEAETGFGDSLLHGEAVALGMCLAGDLAVRLGHWQEGDAARVKRVLSASGLRISLSALPERVRDPATLLAHMRKDKKVRNGRVTLILPHRIGEVFVTADVAPETILDFLGNAAGASSPADAVSH
ncbi:MAG TPA: 3-dehydroquinate synthase [Stellaceae bacterium]|nr:3-dehydroquinate synthase [Stellaceae bacterium]